MKLVNSLIAAAFVFSMATAQAGVIIGGTRIIYHADKKNLPWTSKTQTHTPI